MASEGAAFKYCTILQGKQSLYFLVPPPELLIQCKILKSKCLINSEYQQAITLGITLV